LDPQLEVLVERRTKDLPTLVLLLFAPTRVLFDSKFMKKRIEISAWTWLFLIINFVFLLALPFLKEHLGFWKGLVLLWMLPFSRIVEIGYAFYNDAFDHMEGYKPRSGLSRAERFKLLGRSYVEIAVCYASLYLGLPMISFDHPPATGFESLYFSWTTITTTGFGDIAPKNALTRGMCMTEIGIGLMLIVFAVGTYFSYVEEGPEEPVIERERT
jgi:hypothetical protein